MALVGPELSFVAVSGWVLVHAEAFEAVSEPFLSLFDELVAFFRCDGAVTACRITPCAPRGTGTRLRSCTLPSPTSFPSSSHPNTQNRPNR